MSTIATSALAIVSMGHASDLEVHTQPPMVHGVLITKLLAPASSRPAPATTKGAASATSELSERSRAIQVIAELFPGANLRVEEDTLTAMEIECPPGREEEFRELMLSAHLRFQEDSFKRVFFVRLVPPS